MKRQYFQIKMDPEAHALIKYRAKELEVPIGEFVENLISSLELKLEQALEVAGEAPERIDNHMIRILLDNSLSIDRNELMDAIGKEFVANKNPKPKFKASITV
jgi:hypothetical protein